MIKQQNVIDTTILFSAWLFKKRKVPAYEQIDKNIPVLLGNGNNYIICNA